MIHQTLHLLEYIFLYRFTLQQKYTIKYFGCLKNFISLSKIITKQINVVCNAAFNFISCLCNVRQERCKTGRKGRLQECSNNLYSVHIVCLTWHPTSTNTRLIQLMITRVAIASVNCVLSCMLCRMQKMRVCLLFFRIYIKLFLILCITPLYHNRRNIKITIYVYTKKKKKKREQECSAIKVQNLKTPLKSL